MLNKYSTIQLNHPISKGLYNSYRIKMTTYFPTYSYLAQHKWLRRYDTSQKFVGSSPKKIIEYFTIYQILAACTIGLEFT
jgi:hypothetical protein